MFQRVTIIPPRVPPPEKAARALFWAADLHISLACDKGWVKCSRALSAPAQQQLSKVGCGVHATEGLLHQEDNGICARERVRLSSLGHQRRAGLEL